MKTANKIAGAFIGIAFFALGLFLDLAYAQPTSIVKLSDSSTTFGAGFTNMAISADGRYVVSGLGIVGSSGTQLVYRYDRSDNTRILVSQSTGGTTADGSSYNFSISGDGRYVVFASGATNLVAGDSNNIADLFLRDVENGTTIAVTDVTDNDNGLVASSSAFITADGSTIFYRGADSITDYYQLMKYDVDSTVTSLVIPGEDDFINLLDVSSNGRFLLVTREFVILGEDTVKVYRLDLNDNSFIQVDVNSQGIDGSTRYGTDPGARMNGDGRYVTFSSTADNLASADTNSRADIFLRDIDSETTTRISVRSDGVQPSNGCSSPDISVDAKFIVFVCNSSQLVFGDTNEASDVYLYDRTTNGIKELSSTVSGTQGNFGSSDPVISADGAYVAFESDASNLVSGDTNSSFDQFLVGTGSSVTLDQCILDTAKTEAGSCGCGFLETDADSNGIADCLDPDGNTTPAAPTVKVKGRTVTVTVTALPEPNARMIVFAEKQKVIVRERGAIGKKKLSFTLGAGRYLVSVVFKRPGGIATQESAQVTAKIK